MIESQKVILAVIKRQLETCKNSTFKFTMCRCVTMTEYCVYCEVNGKMLTCNQVLIKSVRQQNIY